MKCGNGEAIVLVMVMVMASVKGVVMVMASHLFGS